jgi:predicted DNA helicase
MAEWVKKREELDEMFAEAERLQREAVADILDKAEVVCTTNSTAGSEMLKGMTFDIAVIDEATQAVEPACLIPLLKTEKAVLAGDHRQLPPTILNFDAEREGLSVTMFERLLDLYGEGLKSLLEVQYRMHRDIMEFPNREFYDGRIRAHGSVEAHTLSDLEGYSVPKKGPEHTEAALDPKVPLVLIDVGDQNAEETPRGSKSKRNRSEANVVKELITAFREAGLKDADMAVISPYDAQVDLLRSMIWGRDDRPELEIGTVDGFQGREKEAIILSLVRSNRNGELGFLTDIRRLNVSITRAKRKLIVVGNLKTISSHTVYKDMVEHFKEKGNYLKP